MMDHVRDCRIMNDSLRKQFYHITTILNQIYARKITIIGNIFRRKYSHLTTRILTSWCNRKRRCVGILTKKRKKYGEELPAYTSQDRKVHLSLNLGITHT